MSLYRIKPLEWTAIGTGESSYPGDGAYNPMGGFIVRKTDSGEWVYHDGTMYKPCDSLEAGKVFCEAHWRARLAEVLEPVEHVKAEICICGCGRPQAECSCPCGCRKSTNRCARVMKAEKTGERIPELERRGVESTRIAAMQAEVGSMALQVADLKRQRDELQAASNLALERRRAGDWRPIDTAPKDSVAILLWCPERKNIHKCWWRNGEWVHRSGEVLMEEPTRWQPLQETPQ